MAEQKKPTKKSQPISDVESPGTTAASPTSKSIIIKNGPIIKDPMVVEESVTEPKAESSKNVVKAGGSSKIKLQPLPTSDIIPSKEPEATEDVKTSAPDGAKKDEEKSSETETPEEPAQKSKSEHKTDADTGKESDTKDKPTNSPAEQDAAEASRKAEHDTNLQKIVDSKTYYLPIDAVKKRKTKRFVILGITLSIFLILVWINIALDAGLINIDGVSPLTHFFSS